MIYWLISLLALCVFAIGVVVGARCEEAALRYREQRLYLERRRVNAQIRALHAHNEVNKLVVYAQNELRQNALAHAQDMPFVVEPEFEHAAIPSQRNGAKEHRSQPAAG